MNGIINPKKVNLFQDKTEETVIKMKNIIILFLLIFSKYAFGQLVAPDYFDIVINISENGKDYEKIGEFYKKTDEEDFLKTRGVHERLIKPRKDVIYFIEYKKNDKQIALYFFMPFQQETKSELGFEMVLVNHIQFDITDLDNGTYFIDYSKDLYPIPDSYELKQRADGISNINIPAKTLKKCNISNEFISKENYSKNKN